MGGLSKTYGYGKGGMLLRQFQLGKETNISLTKEPIKDEGYLNIEGAPNLMIDILSSISRDIITRMRSHHAFEKDEQFGHFLVMESLLIDDNMSTIRFGAPSMFR